MALALFLCRLDQRGSEKRRPYFGFGRNLKISFGRTLLSWGIYHGEKDYDMRCRHFWSHMFERTKIFFCPNGPRSTPNDQTKGGMATAFLSATPNCCHCFKSTNISIDSYSLFRTWAGSLPPCDLPCRGPRFRRRRRPLHRDSSCSSQRRFCVCFQWCRRPRSGRSRRRRWCRAPAPSPINGGRFSDSTRVRITRRTAVVKETPVGRRGCPGKKVRSATRWRRLTRENTHTVRTVWTIKRQDLNRPRCERLSPSDFLVDSSLPHQFSVQQCSRQRPDSSALLLLSHFDKLPRFLNFSTLTDPMFKSTTAFNPFIRQKYWKDH